MKFLRFKPVLFLASLLILFENNAYAYSSEPTLGGLASNITGVMGSLGHFLTAIAFVIGFGFGVGSVIKYKAHRDNPQMVGLREPITLLVLCLAFVTLGLVSYFVGLNLFGAAPSGGYQGTSTF